MRELSNKEKIINLLESLTNNVHELVDQYQDDIQTKNPKIIIKPAIFIIEEEAVRTIEQINILLENLS